MGHGKGVNMKRTPLLLITALSGMIVSAHGADTYTVPVNANIFSAGLSTPVAPAGGGAGVLPVFISLPPVAPGLQFQASGTYTFDSGYHVVGPDGNTGDWSPMNINSYGGISGYYGPGAPLCGVFLTGKAPQLPAPATLDFTGNNQLPDFLTLSPAIGQVFFIGDGLAYGSGAIQIFIVPTGATRLFLGIPDCFNAVGDPGWYGDNIGSLTVTVTVIPEPASVALTGLSIAFLLARRSGPGAR
jgi:hypothetical protein